MTSYDTNSANNFEVGPRQEGFSPWASPAEAAQVARRKSAYDLPMAEAGIDRALYEAAAVTAANRADQAGLLAGSFAERQAAALAYQDAQANVPAAESHLLAVEADIAAAQKAAEPLYQSVGGLVLTSLSFPRGTY